VAVAALLSVILHAPPAWSHARSVSYSTWTVQPDGASVRLRLSRLDVSALAGQSGRPADLTSQLRLTVGGEPCQAGELTELSADPAWHAYAWTISCRSTGGPRRIESDLLVTTVPAHLHFAQVVGAGQSAELVLDEQQRSAALPVVGQPGEASVVPTLRRFIPLGLTHIASGVDHLVFLLALALLATGFTVGHSITLSLAVLGYAKPNASSVEALIGLSIALVAVENVWLGQERASPRVPVTALGAIAAATLLAALWGVGGVTALAGVALCSACYIGLQIRAERPERLRLAVTALFGLIHGFGFAGVLSEMALPRERLGVALFGFNLGVELGQLVLLGLALIGLKLVQRFGERAYLALVEWGSAGAAGAGTFWFVTRAFG
jgi:hypothetical protein